MRRLIIILLLFALGVPFWGTYTRLQVKKATVKEDVSEHLREGTSANELVLLKFSISDSKMKLRWEHDREFEYRGQMYDLIETTIKGDSVRYLCYWDKEETRLNRELEEFVSWALRTASGEDGSGKGLLLVKPLFYQELTHWAVHLFGWYAVASKHWFTALSFLSITLPPALPPPEL